MRLLLSWWVPLDRTDFLARSVNPLSTKVLSDSLVSLSAAFFEWWRIHYHATLFVPQSSVCLASSSVPLRTYVFNPNNHIILAGIREPNSLSCQVLSTFHVALEQTFAFYDCKVGIEPTTYILEECCSTKWAICETYQEVLLQLLRILLDTKYNTPHVFRLAD